MAQDQQPRNIAHAVVIKDQDIFLISERDGSVPAGSQDGFGLYYHDCRYLDKYSLSFAKTEPNSLLFSSVSCSAAEFELTNEELTLPGGARLDAQKIGCALKRSLDGRNLTLNDVFTIHNYDVQPHSLPIVFSFDSQFEDVFEIRGLRPKQIGRVCRPHWIQNKLVLCYDGADEVERRLEICFQEAPSKTTEKGAEFDLHIPASESRTIALTVRVLEQKQAGKPQPNQSRSSRRKERVHIESDWELLDRAFMRSMADLEMLSGELDGLHYFAAGLPWYGALFGRDSIIASLQTLAFDPGIAASTLRLLANYQAATVDPHRDAEPGKILHELRRGELANLNEIPQTPYYGSVDSTPLFLLLVGEYTAWTGDLRLFTELRSNVERALAWIDGNCARHADYLCYETKASQGLGNQGWKDSGDAIVNKDGSLAKPPIALPEVQGYVFKAKLLLADIYARAGETQMAEQLRAQAQDLKKRFNQDFWIASAGHYALALDRDCRPAAVVSSNPGQAIWSGIVDESRVEKAVHTLMTPDMFNGWGIRTLSSKEKRYNPIGYHLGTVWPHDNALIATGFKRHGFNTDALRIFEGLVEASQDFAHNRLPEVFGGFSTDEYAQPVRYPVACHPQAWASGSIPYLLTHLLGLESDAFNRKLRINRPALPDRLHTLEWHCVRVATATVGLRFKRKPAGEVTAELIDADGAVTLEAEGG
ncbi:MAG: amylo-alpha-1,6-glucosidase [Bryobacterales bacterium]|nr:amylo-alpha-1,6-glucosidase [Bryobacterales bacterium]MBV9401286.1 amylo-alpha-1,6-glucosidase [Bryobacterales bacterium]